MRFAVAVLLLAVPFIAAEEPPKSWKGEFVWPKKRAKDIKFGDRVNDKNVTYRLSVEFPIYIKVLEQEGDRIRIDDGKHKGWTPQSEWVRDREAFAYFDNLVKADPKDVFALSMRGETLKWLGKYDEAIEEFTACIRMEPDNASHFSSRAAAWLYKQDCDKAIKDLDESIRLDPQIVSVIFRRGLLLHYQKRDYDKAMRDYNEGIRLDPMDGKAFNIRANLWRDLKEYDKAIKDYNESVRLSPQHPFVSFCNRAQVYAILKMYEQAVADFESAMNEKVYSLCWVKRDYARFLSTCPDAKYRDGAKALKLAKSAIEAVEPFTTWEDHAALAAALAETGDFDGAVREQKAALADQSMHADDKKEQEARLKLYQAKKPFRDE